jgi:hypothetical protein
MKKYLVALIPVMLLLIIIASATPAHSQLILVNLKVKIVKVERENNRLQVRVHEKGNKDVQYVNMDANTKFSINNKEISFDKAWKTFKVDQIIRVKGGYQANFHVKAKSIYM